MIFKIVVEKFKIEKLDKLYSIFINKLDPLYVECKKIYDEKIKKNNDNNDDNNKKKDYYFFFYYYFFYYLHVKKQHENFLFFSSSSKLSK